MTPPSVTLGGFMLGPYTDRAWSKPFWVAGSEEQEIEIEVKFQAFDPGARIHVSIQTDDGDVIKDFVAEGFAPDANFKTSLKPNDPGFQLIPPPPSTERAKPLVPIKDHVDDPRDGEPNLLNGYRIVFSLEPGPGRLPVGIHGLYALRGGPAVTLTPPKGPGEDRAPVWRDYQDLGPVPASTEGKEKRATELSAANDWRQHLQETRMNFESLQQLHRFVLDSFSQAQHASELLQMHSSATTRQLQESATRFRELASTVPHVSPHVPIFDASHFQRMSEQTERLSREARESGERAAEEQRRLDRAPWMTPDAASQLSNWGNRPWLDWEHH